MPCGVPPGTAPDYPSAEEIRLKQLLCSTLRRIGKIGKISAMPADVLRWWSAHKREDQRRRIRERAARRAR